MLLASFLSLLHRQLHCHICPGLTQVGVAMWPRPRVRTDALLPPPPHRHAGNVGNSQLSAQSLSCRREPPSAKYQPPGIGAVSPTAAHCGHKSLAPVLSRTALKGCPFFEDWLVLWLHHGHRLPRTNSTSSPPPTPPHPIDGPGGNLREMYSMHCSISKSCLLGNLVISDCYMILCTLSLLGLEMLFP